MGDVLSGQRQTLRIESLNTGTARAYLSYYYYYVLGEGWFVWRILISSGRLTYSSSPTCLRAGMSTREFCCALARRHKTKPLERRGVPSRIDDTRVGFLFIIYCFTFDRNFHRRTKKCYSIVHHTFLSERKVHFNRVVSSIRFENPD